MDIKRNLISRNHTPLRRTKKNIIFIVVHYVGALGDAYDNTEYYKNNYVKASADFFVGHNGDIWQANDYYNYYSWHCGGPRQSNEGGRFFKICTNENSIGIEMCVKKKNTNSLNARDKDWYFTNETVESTAWLVSHLMKELNIDADHVIRHYDVNGKFCPNPYVDTLHPGAWEKFKAMLPGGGESAPVSDNIKYYRVRKTWADVSTQLGAYEVLENAKNNCPAGYCVFDDEGKVVFSNITAKTAGTQASSLKGRSEAEIVNIAGKLCQKDQEKSGILAAVSAAQFILESGYASTDLAQNANNCFGMKTFLSNNDWPGSTWDGTSKYSKITTEEYTPGQITKIRADFRRYDCIEDSIADHSAYLNGAKNGGRPRYAGLKGETDYRKAAQIIKGGGYATDSQYVQKLCSIIERWNLTQYNAKTQAQKAAPGDTKSTAKKTQASSANVRYRVQVGAFKTKSAADAFQKTLKKRGIDSFTELGDDYFRVYAGSYKGKKNAQKRAQELKAAGIDAVIKN